MSANNIRAAKFADIPRLMELMAEAHLRSEYALNAKIDREALKDLFLSSIQCSANKGLGSTCVFVIDVDGKLEGFIIGLIDRIYMILDAWMATDLFFYVSKAAGPRDFIRLFDAWERWALSNRKVTKLGPSVSNAIVEDPEKLARFYERRGYTRCGTMFEKAK